MCLQHNVMDTGIYLWQEKKCILELLFIVRAVNNHLAKDRRTLTHKNVFATL